MSKVSVLFVLGRYDDGERPILCPPLLEAKTGVDEDLSLDGVRRLVKSAPYL